MAAADWLTNDDEPESAPGDPANRQRMEHVLATVATGSGQPVEYWLSHTSAELLAALDAIAQARAAAAGAEVKDHDESAEAMRDLLYCVERIRARAQAES